MSLFINIINLMYSNPYTTTYTERFPYVEAENYNHINSIVAAFPHLKNINQQIDWASKSNVIGIVIRSANDDNVHKVKNKLLRQLSMGFGRQLLKIGPSSINFISNLNLRENKYTCFSVW